MRKVYVRAIWCALLLHLLSLCNLSAQTEPELKATYVGHRYYLVGFWAADKLHFDSSGHLQRPAKATSITLSGFDVTKVELKGDVLLLEGKRVGIKVRDSKVEYVDLPDHIRLEVAAPDAGTYADRLSMILTPTIETLIPKIPQEMQGAMARLFPGDKARMQLSHAVKPAPSSSPVYQIGGAIKPPLLLHQVDPRYSDVAMKLKLNADVLVHCHVEENGTTSHIELLQAAGMGLDEQALYAVSQYVFSPATIQKKPVAVELNVSVSFRIF